MSKCIKIISIMILTVMLVSACANNGDDSGKENYIYFLSETKNSLVKIDYNIKAEETTEVVTELLKSMDIESEEEGEYFPAKPEMVKTPEFEIEDKVITLLFNNTYEEMNNTQEILYRASLVLTLTQVEGISYVNIYIGEQPLVDSSQVPLGNMAKNDFVDLSGELSDLEQNISLTMYYPNQDGDKIFSKKYEDEIKSDISMEKMVINKLVGKAFPKDTEVQNIMTRNGVCYIDFSKEFNLEFLGIEDEVAIYSIVNSLCELSNVSEVKISVDGDSDLKFHENISLDQNFTRNLDLLEK